MNEKISYLDDEKKFPIIFTLNVMEIIQDKYGSMDAWRDIVFVKDDPNKEPDIKALLFGLTAMVNEGIEIVNEESEKKLEVVTTKQVGRIITKIGLEGSIAKLGNSIIQANQTSNPKNE